MEPGIDLERGVEFLSRIGLTVLSFQDQAQLVMGFRGAGIGGDRGAKMLGGLSQLFPVFSNEA